MSAYSHVAVMENSTGDALQPFGPNNNIQSANGTQQKIADAASSQSAPNDNEILLGKEDISTSHRKLLTEFERYASKSNTESTQPDEKLVERFIEKQRREEAGNKPGDRHVHNLPLLGEKDLSILHFMLGTPSKFQARLPLFRWVMTKYPEIISTGLPDKKSILHLAVKNCQTTPSAHECLGSLIQMYPAQLAHLLTEAPDKEQLLARIMPFIRFRAGPEFLAFFGQTKVQVDAHVCCCRFCQGETEVMRNLTSSQKANEIPEISEEKSNDVITIRIGDKGIVLQNSPPNASTENLFKYENEQTTLHLASEYYEGDSSSQFELVKRLFAWCPKALQAMDNAGRSPYLHRISSRSRPELNKDEIAFFLKDQIMHIMDRDLILDLLYGKTLANQSPRQDMGGERRHVDTESPPFTRQEREIHVDLREIQISAPSSAKKDLLSFLRSLDFENILQYVQIPQNPFQSNEKMLATSDASEMKPNEQGIGRQDFSDIFSTLRDKGVEKIVNLIVDDDDCCPHSDEIIEELGPFNIEEFQWRKMDLSSIVLQRAAPHARAMHLFSSGNHSVLRDWSSCDGLNQLKLLESVYVNIYWKVESEEKTVKYARDFIHRMAAHAPNVRKIEVRLEPMTSRSHEQWYDQGCHLTTNVWLANMQKFATFVTNINTLLQPKNEVRVAVLDNGIDWSYANEIKCIGRSFYVERRLDFDRHKPWYNSSDDHGTLMAALVRKICPAAKLYVARLHQTESEDGRLQPTAESAAKAIDWAIQMNVHIISMSWTIPGIYPCLDEAVKRARKAKIIMFGSASDQGAHIAEKPYMANQSARGVICIGGAKEAGYGDDRSRSEADFFFPGETQGIPQPLPHMKSSFGSKFGSSVATALASGLTALIMHLVELCNFGQDVGVDYRAQLQLPEKIRNVFNDMTTKRRQPDLRKDNVIPVAKFFKPNWAELAVGWDETEVERKLTRCLKKVLRALIEDQTDVTDED